MTQITVLGMALGLTVGCGDSPSEAEVNLSSSPANKAILAESAPKPARVSMTVQAKDDGVSMRMDAPIEHIQGRVMGRAVSGELTIDPTDIASLRGTLDINISKIEISREADHDEDRSFTDWAVSEVQNDHARRWLEIDESTPREPRANFSHIVATIVGAQVADPPRTPTVAVASRPVRVVADTEILLHGITRTYPVVLVVHGEFDGEKGLLNGVSISTEVPIMVGLADHDVRPRASFGVLAQKTLASLSAKVAQVAAISASVSAHVDPSRSP